MQNIQSYCRANWPRLLMALIVCAVCVVGGVHLDPVGGLGMAAPLMLGELDVKAIEAAIQKATKSVGDRMAELSARLIELEQKGGIPFRGELNHGSGVIAEAFEKNDTLKAMARGEFKGNTRILLPAGALETKAAILGPVAAGAAALQHPDSSSGVQGLAMRRMTVRALLPVVPTEAGATQFTRMTVFTNAAAAQGAGSSPAEKEGQVKAESSMTFTLEVAPIATIAHWIPASSQVLSDMPGLEQLVRTFLAYGLAVEEEDELLNGGGDPEIEGLLTIATAFNRGATADTRGDTIRKAITQLLLADHVCNGIVVNPADDEALDLEKDNDGRYMLVKVGGKAWQVPVVSTNAISAGQWLAGDFTSAVVRERQGVAIEISNSHSDFFTRNMIAIRAELREGLEVHRPAGFVKGSFHQAGQPG